MGDNNEQEAADLDAIHNDGYNLFEVIYRGGRLDNNYDDYREDHYTVPDGPFRLVIHASVTVIDRCACYGCTTLTEVVFHENVTHISEMAFYRCSNLQRVELPAGLLRLEYNAFSYCTSVREIVIPARVQFIGNYVFEQCKSLERLVFAPTTNVVEVGCYMLSGCSNLRFVTLPHNLRSIPHGFCQDCTALVRIHIPDSIEEIEGYAFNGSGLWSLEILGNLHRIGFMAFDGCSSLKKVVIHSTDLNLASDIFANCPSLTVIMIAPWLWPTLFNSMNGHPEFIFKFFRQYNTQILPPSPTPPPPQWPTPLQGLRQLLPTVTSVDFAVAVAVAVASVYCIEKLSTTVFFD